MTAPTAARSTEERMSQFVYHSPEFLEDHGKPVLKQPLRDWVMKKRPPEPKQQVPRRENQ